MSLERILGPTEAVPQQGASQRRSITSWMSSHLVPEEGWVTFFFMLIILLMVSWSVEQANWVETPGLVGIMTLAALTGLTLAKIKAPFPLLHLTGLAVGFVVIVWQVTSLTEATSLVAQVQEVWERVRLWTEAAFTGGISIDLLPFSLMLLIVGWLIGYISSWFLFRYGNFWLSLILPGVAILTNLSYVSSRSREAMPFFIFLLVTMLLVIRMNILLRPAKGANSSIDYSPMRGWGTMNSALWLSVFVVLLAALLPLRTFISSPLKGFWNDIRAPAVFLEDEFERLLSGLPSRKPLAFRTFGDSLPFQGNLSLGGDTALWVRSEYPSYWTSQTYGIYTSQGWLGGEAKALEVGRQEVPPPPQESLGRTKVDQEVQVGYATGRLFTGGNLYEIDRPAQVITLVPRSFTISMKDLNTDADFPSDIKAIARDFRANLSSAAKSQLEFEIARLLADDLVLERIFLDEDDTLTSITVTRKDPILPEVVSSRFSRELSAAEKYDIISSVSLATDDELRVAGTQYPTSITDNYLQLPDSVTPRVKELARQLTDSTANPHDKALSIQSYLRDMEFTLKVQPPAFDVDGVDHFLFETKKGYGDYFASAMAVMLRSVGIPARIAAGYSPGIYDETQGLFVIGDSDSHVWPQVHFPRFGWIDFEPTPNKPLPRRELLLTDEGVALGGLDRLDDEEEEGRDEELAGLGSEAGGLASSSNIVARNWRTILTVPGAVLLVLSTVAFALWMVWNRSLMAVPVAERGYAKMNRLATFAMSRRKPQQTPHEYAEAIAQAFPDIRDDTRTVAGAYVRSKYGQAELGEEEQGLLQEAWLRVRGTLARSTLRRLFHISKG